jgi:hypothetical protein
VEQNNVMGRRDHCDMKLSVIPDHLVAIVLLNGQAEGIMDT